MKALSILLPALLLAGFLRAQPTAPARGLSAGPWRESATQLLPATLRKARPLLLDEPALARLLQAAPAEAEASRGVLLPLPLPDGRIDTFSVWQTPVLHPALAARYPAIRTFAGRSLTRPGVTGRFDLTPQGFHAYVRGGGQGPEFVDPVPAEPGRYAAFAAADQQPDPVWRCLTTGQLEPAPTAGRTQAAPFGSQLLTYRLALACTGEYATRVCQPAAPTVPATLAAMTTAVNRVTGIYEQEIGVRLQLIVNNTVLIFLDAATDPYTNNNGSAMLTENRNTLRDLIGADNYDIGHVFSTGGGGIAGLGVVCLGATTGSANIRNQKARGVTGLANPTGDFFYVDYVAHEMGHQFGGNHTFNSETSSCGGGNRNDATAIEPGSGSTIMAYAGICGADNIQTRSDAFFHAISQDEIRTYITSGGGSLCPVSSSTGNTPPSVNAGPDYTIPRGTPFVLTGSGTDANNDVLAYSWEQTNPDNTPTGGAPAAAATSITAPLFRSFAPGASPSRTFPRLTDILAGTTTTGEILPQVARVLRFRLTARDNRSGVSSDEALVTVLDVNPFLITNANTPFTQAPNSTFTLTWDQTGTTAAPISAGTVNILFSADGGLTFPYLLAATTPNDGSQQIVLPNLTTSTGRLRVQPVGQVFFDINNANITLAGPLPVTLTSFEATAHNGTIETRWTTAQELRNAGFEVQAQGPGETGFRTRAFVAGQGTSSTPHAYQHTLRSLAPGRWHLRLHQLDQSTAAAPEGSYTAVRTVQLQAGAAAVQVWPNPAPTGRTATASIYLPAGGPAQLELYDLLGRRVLSLPLVLAAGGTEVPLPLRGVPAGLYVWQLTAAGHARLQGRLELLP
jgi:hypothetical protein